MSRADELARFAVEANGIQQIRLLLLILLYLVMYLQTFFQVQATVLRTSKDLISYSLALSGNSTQQITQIAITSNGIFNAGLQNHRDFAYNITTSFRIRPVDLSVPTYIKAA